MIQNISYSGKRVETGAVKFGDDWPGFFHRGDECMGLIDVLGVILGDKNNKLTLGAQLVLNKIKMEFETVLQFGGKDAVEKRSE